MLFISKNLILCNIKELAQVHPAHQILAEFESVLPFPYVIRSSENGNPCYAKSLQSCPTLCDPIDGSPPGSPIPGILQGRTLEWAAISFSNA